MFRTLGWINAALLLIVLLPWLGTRLNKLAFSGKNKGLQSFVRAMRKVHKPAGVLLVILAYVHGTMALGSLRLHTGTILFFAALVTAIFGAAFWQIKKRGIFTVHKALALLTALLFLFHWLIPGALRNLM